MSPHATAEHPPRELKCPHCHNIIDSVVADDDEIVCPSCGSSFRLDVDRTQSWSKDKLPKLDRFDLIDVVGRGTFGTVYRARDKQLQRTVAVKVPRSGQLATQEDEDRFVREARNAAQLQHPGIVPVYEVGKSEAFPYIVCEFIDGGTLADTLTARKLGFRETAKLIARVAEAVEHAHQQGVVHRDLKPSNIMLTPDGTPRVMDFGLAKRDAGEATMTLEGQVLGTPAYMSPEQASGQAHHVDGRSDVYSVGSILYELLAGELPFRGNQRMLIQQVLHDEPRAPRTLNDRIPRDLETICLKAMAKEPARRYQTAQALADDLNRYLSGQPIAARPVGRAERGWRWCRRNPVVAALSALVVLLLVAGTVVSSYFAIEASHRATEALAEKTRADQQAAEALAQTARADEKAVEALANSERAKRATDQATADAERARSEAEKATQVARFLAGMFKESAPFELAGLRFGTSDEGQVNAKLTAREILDRAAARVSTELESQPLIRASLMDTMGNVYVGLGISEQAERLLQEALKLREEKLPSEHLDVAASQHSIGMLRFAQGRFGESVAALEAALATRRKLLGDDHELVDASRMALGCVLGLAKPGGFAHDTPIAVKLERESLAWRRAHFGNTHRETAFAMFCLAGALLNGPGNEGEAAALVLEGTPILIKDPLTHGLGLALNQFQQAEIMKRLGQPDAVLAGTKKGLVVAREAVGDGHVLMMVAREFAVDNFIFCSQFDEAEKICREAIAPLRAGPRSFYLAEALRKLATVLTKKGGDENLHEAATACRESLAISRELKIVPHSSLIWTMKSIADELHLDGTDAESMCRDLLAATKESLEAQLDSKKDGRLEVDVFAQLVVQLGTLLRNSGRLEEAELLYQESLVLTQHHKDEFYSMWLTKNLAELKRDQKALDQAEILYRQSAELAEAIRRIKPGLGASWKATVLVGLAECLEDHEKGAEVEAVLREAIALGNKDLVLQAQSRLAALLRQRGVADESIDLLRQRLATAKESLIHEKGQDHEEALSFYAESVSSLAAALQIAGRMEKVDDVYREALPLVRRGNDEFRSMSMTWEWAEFHRRNGQLPQAERLYHESLTLAESLSRKKKSVGGWPGAIREGLALALIATNRTADAELVYKQMIESENRYWPERAARNWAAMMTQAGKPEEAETVFARSLASMKQSLERDTEAETDERPRVGVYVNTTLDFAQLLQSRGKLAEAEAALVEALRIAEVRNAKAARVRLSVAIADLKAAGGNTVDAEERYRKITAAQDNKSAVPAYASLWLLLRNRGANDDATAVLREALPQVADNAFASWFDNWLEFYDYAKRNRAERASLLELVEAAKGTLELARLKVGKQNPQVASLLVNLASRLCELGEFEQAEPIAREGLEIRRRVLTSGNWRLGSAESNLGRALLGLARYEEAEPLLVSGYVMLNSALPNEEQTILAAKALVAFYEATQKPEQADKYRKLLPPAAR